MLSKLCDIDLNYEKQTHRKKVLFFLCWLDITIYDLAYLHVFFFIMLYNALNRHDRPTN
jgi:hypothetical protein